MNERKCGRRRQICALGLTLRSENLKPNGKNVDKFNLGMSIQSVFGQRNTYNKFTLCSSNQIEKWLLSVILIRSLRARYITGDEGDREVEHLWCRSKWRCPVPFITGTKNPLEITQKTELPASPDDLEGNLNGVPCPFLISKRSGTFG